MKILIVEDEPKTGDYLRKRLAEAGFVVDLACDGVDGLLTAGLLVMVVVVQGKAVESDFHELDDQEFSGKTALSENLLQRATPAAVSRIVTRGRDVHGKAATFHHAARAAPFAAPFTAQFAQLPPY